MILITGAAGFIGSVIARKLNLQWRQDLILTDRLHDQNKWMNLRKIIYRDYLHADQLMQAPSDFWRNISHIVHMGACSSTTERDVDFLMSNNFAYSKFLWNKACELDIPFIYASSAATYGDGSLGYIDDHQTSAQLIPLNPYGYSKQIFDQWALEHDRNKKAPPRWYGLKFFNVYGPNEYHKGEMRSIVKKSYEQIQTKGAVKLFKSHRSDFKHGEQLRDFVYVMDAADIVIKILASDTLRSNHNGIYNLGTGKARSFLDLTNAVFKSLGKKPEIEFIDMPESIRAQYQYFTEAKMQKIQNIFPDQNFSSLESGVQDYVQNYLMKGDQNCYF
jgi:ADP-L-glycero-D-manno-heptose 6-epimerase